MPAWVPPPYPRDRLQRLHDLARSSTGEVLDLSVGDPCDPAPRVAMEALERAAGRAVGYPPSVGLAELREAASHWMRRRLGVEVDPSQVMACIGTKELVASLPHLLHLNRPERDTVLYPAIAYPTYEMGAQLAGLRAVPVPLDGSWLPDVTRVDEADARRALVLWLNEPANPTGSVATADWYHEVVTWARERGVVVASDECYVEFVFEGAPVSALSAGTASVLAVHSLSKRSNLTGLRCGFVAGDPGLVGYLAEVRKHAGAMVPGPVQGAAAAALADDEHVEEQRARYRERRALVLEALAAAGLRHDGGPGTFYLWVTDGQGVADGWALAERMARAGAVVAPGDLYGPPGSRHVRVALVHPVERLLAFAERLRV